MAVARKLFVWMIAAVAILLTASSRVSAQGATGTISGTVVDSATTQPLGNVAVGVGNRTARSGENGQFTLTGVPAGSVQIGQ